MKRLFQPAAPSAVSAPARYRPITVALVGADGAGKSTVSRMLHERSPLPLPVTTLYMGVNPSAGSAILPTIRLLLSTRPFSVVSSVGRGGGPRPASVRRPGPQPQRRHLPWRRAVKDAARLTAWMLEEWLRQLIAASYLRRGYLVVFDRHFFADYYHAHIAHGSNRGLFPRLHGWMLLHAYPKPDLVICLDAPSDILFARKQDDSAEWLEQRRQQYLDLTDVVPELVVIDAGRPLEAVFADVVATIREAVAG